MKELKEALTNLARYWATQLSKAGVSPVFPEPKTATEVSIMQGHLQCPPDGVVLFSINPDTYDVTVKNDKGEMHFPAGEIYDVIKRCGQSLGKHKFGNIDKPGLNMQKFFVQMLRQKREYVVQYLDFCEEYERLHNEFYSKQPKDNNAFRWTADYNAHRDIDASLLARHPYYEEFKRAYQYRDLIKANLRMWRES